MDDQSGCYAYYKQPLLMQTARNAAVDILSIEDGIQPDGAIYKAALEIWQEMNKYTQSKEGLGREGRILGIGASLKKDFCSFNVAPGEYELIVKL